GYIKRVALSAYRAQKRGGKGRSAMDVRDEDFATEIFATNTHTPILFFSSKGKVYKLKTYKLPLGNPQARGRALVNLLPIDQDEKITTILALPEDEESWKDLSIMFATDDGNVRRNSMDQFTDIRSSGKIAMKLDDKQNLIGVALCTEANDIMLSTKSGKCIRFPVSKLRIFQSRNSTGVRGIKLESGNEVIAMSVLIHSEADMVVKDQYLKISVEKRIELKEAMKFNLDLETNPSEDLLAQPQTLPKIRSELDENLIKEMAANEDFILTITKNGFGKRSSAYEYRITNRGGSGITNIITSKRNGDVVASFPIDNSDQVMIITNKGTLIRSDISTVRVTGRNTQGVTLIKAKDQEKVVSVARIAHSGNKEIDDMEVGEGEEGAEE
ncbi:MAG: DNA gyrase subunit A, partial [Rickettsiales bacterium]